MSRCHTRISARKLCPNWQSIFFPSWHVMFSYSNNQEYRRNCETFTSLCLIYLFKTFFWSFRIILKNASETAQHACWVYLQPQNSFGIVNVLTHRDIWHPCKSDGFFSADETGVEATSVIIGLKCNKCNSERSTTE